MEEERQKTEIKSTIGKVLEGMKMFSCRAMGMNIKRKLYGVSTPTTLHGAETEYDSSREEEIKYNKRRQVCVE